MGLTDEQRKVIEDVLASDMGKKHYPGWIAGDSHSTCSCGWTFNLGLADTTYISTPEHQEHLKTELAVLLESPLLEVYFEAYRVLAPYLVAFKAADGVKS